MLDAKKPKKLTRGTFEDANCDLVQRCILPFVQTTDCCIAATTLLYSDDNTSVELRQHTSEGLATLQYSTDTKRHDLLPQNVIARMPESRRVGIGLYFKESPSVKNKSDLSSLSSFQTTTSSCQSKSHRNIRTRNFRTCFELNRRDLFPKSWIELVATRFFKQLTFYRFRSLSLGFAL